MYIYIYINLYINKFYKYDYIPTKDKPLLKECNKIWKKQSSKKNLIVNL